MHLYICIRVEPEHPVFLFTDIYCRKWNSLYLHPRENLPHFSCSVIFARKRQTMHMVIWIHVEPGFLECLCTFTLWKLKQIPVEAGDDKGVLGSPNETPTSSETTLEFHQRLSVFAVLRIAKWPDKCSAAPASFPPSLPSFPLCLPLLLTSSHLPRRT